MSDGEFYAYLGALVVSAIVPAFLAARATRQPAGFRVVDALLAAGFLGYAGYLAIENPADRPAYYAVFAAPAAAVIVALVSRVRSGRRAPASPGYGPRTYEMQPGPTPAEPNRLDSFQSAAALFAPPPRPGGPAPSHVDPGSYGAMPSGLSGHHGPGHAMPTGRPSGLPVPPVPADPGPQPYQTATTQQFRRPPAEQPPTAEFQPPPAPHYGYARGAPPDGPQGPPPGYRQIVVPGYPDSDAAHSAPQGYPPTASPEYPPAPRQHRYREPGAPDAAYGAADRPGRHGAPEPAAAELDGEMPLPAPDTYGNAAYRPAHGEAAYGSATYPREPDPTDPPGSGPAVWPPFRQ